MRHANRERIRALVREAALSLAPRTNSYQVQAALKDRTRYVPSTSTIGTMLDQAPYARPLGKVPIEICYVTKSGGPPSAHQRIVREYAIEAGS